MATAQHITHISYSLNCRGQSEFLGQDACGAKCPPFSQCSDGMDAPVVLLWDAAYPLLPWLPKPSPENMATGCLTLAQ